MTLLGSPQPRERLGYCPKDTTNNEGLERMVDTFLAIAVLEFVREVACVDRGERSELGEVRAVEGVSYRECELWGM